MKANTVKEKNSLDHKPKQPLDKPKKPFLIKQEKNTTKDSSLPTLDSLSRKQATKNKDKIKEDSPTDIPANIIQEKPQVLQESPASIATGSKISPTSSKDIHELFDRLSLRLIKETDRGISTTTLTIENPNSSLVGSKVEIKHYDTAPHSFKLTFETTENCFELIEKQLPVLHEKLQLVLPQCVFHISKPRYKSISSSDKSRRDFDSEEKKNSSHIEKIME